LDPVLPAASNSEVFPLSREEFSVEQGEISPKHGDQGENTEPARRSRAPAGLTGPFADAGGEHLCVRGSARGLTGAHE
jgi:hypothetical protein